MILLWAFSPDVICTNMKSTGSGHGIMAELNGRANFGPLGPFWLVK